MAGDDQRCNADSAPLALSVIGGKATSDEPLNHRAPNVAIVSGRLRPRRRDVEAVLESCVLGEGAAPALVVCWRGDPDESKAAEQAREKGATLVAFSDAGFRLNLAQLADRPLGYRIEGVALQPIAGAKADPDPQTARALAAADPATVEVDPSFDPEDEMTIWLDPYDRKRIRLGDVLSIAEDFVRVRKKTEQQSFAVGVTRWKRRAVGRFLGGAGGPVRFARSPASAASGAKQAGGRVVVWASRKNRGVEDAATASGVPVARIEDGFLRSVGLGAAFVEAASLVLDRSGIYYDPSSPSDLETLLADATISERQTARAARLRERLVAGGVTKYNLGRPAPRLVPDGRLGVLVPGQVEDDASILRGAGAVRTNRDLLAAVRTRRPDAFIVYKPHPDVVAGYRRGAVDGETLRALADAVVVDGAITDLYAQCGAIETMTSLAGFEGLLRGLEVTTHGQPFYAGWGLTEDLAPHPRRGRKRSLDELVAAALILYPLYRDPVTGLPCGPETALDRLLEQRTRAETGIGRLAARLRHGYALARHRTLGPIARRLQ